MSVDNDKNKNKRTSDIPSDAERSVQMLCPSCHGVVHWDHQDDIGTAWYKCEHCGEQTTHSEQAPQHFCIDCKKLNIETCPFINDKAPPNRQSVACPSYEEKLEQNERSKPGLSKTLDWIEKDDQEKKSQADRLVTLCLQKEPILFTDQTGMPFAYVKQKNVSVTLPLRSKNFKSWLSSLLWESEQKAPGNEAINSALNILISKAIFEGPRITLYNRVAPGDSCIWLDMTDDKHRAIKITSEGWSIVDDPPILFKRYSHQLPLCTPVSGGDAWQLLEFLNTATTENERAKLNPEKLDCKEPLQPNTRLIVLCDTISFLIPNIPHPILDLYGPQGCGKSWFFRFVRRTLDPSSIELLTLPKNENERVQQLEHHWIAFYDNITHIPYWMSDTLCRAVSGSGFSKRELYSDDDDVIYSFQRCLGLNGINVAAQNGDLLDRTVLAGLIVFEKDKRKTEEELIAKFEKNKPKILGAFLDVLSKAMKIYPKVKPDRLFRMADFTRWGCAISRVLGRTEKEFLDAYELKVKAQVEEAAHASPVATVLLDSFGTMEEPWEGTPTQLFMRLNEHAKMLGISTRQKVWPKAPNTLVRQLNDLAPSLKSLGLELETGIRAGQERTRKIWINIVRTVLTVRDHEKHGENADDNTDDSKNEPSALPSAEKHGQTTLADDTDDADGTFTNNSGEDSSEHGEPSERSERVRKVLLERTKALTRLIRDIQDKCFLCNTKGRMDWQADLFDGNYKLLCDLCGLELEKQRGETM